MKRAALLVIALLINTLFARSATDTLIIHSDETKMLTNNYFQQIEDPRHAFDIKTVIHNNNFVRCKTKLPGLKVSNSILWIKLLLVNKTDKPYVPITINASVIDHFDLYYVTINRHLIIHQRAQSPNSKPGYFAPGTTLIDCSLLPDSSRLIYLRVQSNSPDVLPIEFNGADKYWEKYYSQNIAFGIFIGIVLIMLFYNTLLFFIVKDHSYLFYIFYVIVFCLSQTLTRGYAHKFIESATLNSYIIPTVRVFFGISILMFINEFLQLKKVHTGIFKFYRIIYAIALLPLLFIVFKKTSLAYNLMSTNAVLISFFLLATGIWLYFKGIKHAKFFMLAWTLFLLSVLISIARNKNMVPYNDFTANIIIYAGVLELVLFSIALADKINFYRYQNEEIQEFALRIARENEKLITGQNIMLEARVMERTKELLESNRSLLNLVENLKAAQQQLIETEKMASLGQLTAGIAHEINNPINFVKSNLKPLRLDFNDIFLLLDKYDAIENEPRYANIFEPIIDFKAKIDLPLVKNEILNLLEGIDDGASRTAEIVQSLRVFSRTDEVELKPADINKSILNTLVLLRSTIPYYIEITPVFDKLKPLNCYPGKLNQVFMNLIHNSIQAIKEKKKHHKESIYIATKDYPDHITIEITDTGTGMTDEVKQKIFDPFFTTKDVGEGTGLGLSIVFGIIEQHRGAIDVATTLGKGTTFIIMLPKTLN